MRVRRYINMNPALQTGTPGHYKYQAEQFKEPDQVPAPNISEDAPVGTSGVHTRSRPRFLDFLKNNIFLDDIILIGLIIILLDEGIDDDFILIMLIYILIAGR